MNTSSQSNSFDLQYGTNKSLSSDSSNYFNDYISEIEKSDLFFELFDKTKELKKEFEDLYSDYENSLINKDRNMITPQQNTFEFIDTIFKHSVLLPIENCIESFTKFKNNFIKHFEDFKINLKIDNSNNFNINFDIGANKILNILKNKNIEKDEVDILKIKEGDILLKSEYLNNYKQFQKYFNYIISFKEMINKFKINDNDYSLNYQFVELEKHLEKYKDRLTDFHLNVVNVI